MSRLAKHRDQIKSGMAIGLVGAALLASCGSSTRSGPTIVQANDATDTGQKLAATFIKAHGGGLDACFGPPPLLRRPGPIQTVASDGATRVAAVNRLVIAIDASGSMAARIDGETKMEAAKRAAVAFLRSVPANTQVGLVAFGHRGNNRPDGKATSCHGVEIVYPLGSASSAQVEAALVQVKATGWTPLAAAITTAGRSFTPSRTSGAQVIYVVSDGLETCGGDPVVAARTLNQGSVKAIVNIIGFDLTPADRAQLSAVASAGGGTFVEAKTGSDIAHVMDEVSRKARAASAMTTEYYDAGARSTDNNIAVGRYTTDLNFCLARTTSAETTGLQHELDARAVTGPEREAALATLRTRHQLYSDRNLKLAGDLAAKSKAANDAIDAQQRSSERRLGVKP